MPDSPSDEVALVIRAASFAAYKHRNHRRKNAEATPYINHPLAVAQVLSVEGAVHDAVILAAALLHDTVEDTETTYEELTEAFGTRVSEIVREVSDDKQLPKDVRKLQQIEHAARASPAAQQVKIADKICNLREILATPPANWSEARKQEYFDWAKAVVDQVRGANQTLARKFDEVFDARKRVCRARFADIEK
ncbi:MAG: HD domain-containing protein [Steroidobacteraceae bacterium]